MTVDADGGEILLKLPEDIGLQSINIILLSAGRYYQKG